MLFVLVPIDFDAANARRGRSISRATTRSIVVASLVLGPIFLMVVSAVLGGVGGFLGRRSRPPVSTTRV